MLPDVCVLMLWARFSMEVAICASTLLMVFSTWSSTFCRDLLRAKMLTIVGASFFRVVMASAMISQVGFLSWACAAACGAVLAMFF